MAHLSYRELVRLSRKQWTKDLRIQIPQMPIDYYQRAKYIHVATEP